MERYQDIINRKRPPLQRHPAMSPQNRAAQFAPFAALNGFDEGIDEIDRRTEDWNPPDEEECNRLNQRMLALIEQPNVSISVRYFIPDSQKEGGHYAKKKGALRRVNLDKRCLIFRDGSQVALDWIVEIR